MNQPIIMSTSEPQPLTDWRPPGWIVGDPDEPYYPEQIERLYREFDAAGYYTRGGKLTETALGKKDEQEARDVCTNRRLLRDAWNTHGAVWQLASALTGVDFRVDPFWNQGAQELPKLDVRLDGTLPTSDGMLTLECARQRLEQDADGVWTYRDHDGVVHGHDIASELAARVAQLGKAPEDFPVNWRQHLRRGKAAAAANGPHSCTAKWLACCAAYGTEEITAAFVPDNGDGWFQNVAMSAQLVVRLGRVHCSPPPGVKASSPRGASALCIWIPQRVRDKIAELEGKLSHVSPAAVATEASIRRRLDRLLPAPVRKVLATGEAFRVPLWSRPRAGLQYALVQRGDIDTTSEDDVVDFGLTESPGPDDCKACHRKAVARKGSSAT